MNKTMLKGVIFDMDGTMFDSEKIWRKMWYQLPETFGMEKNPQVGADMCGTSNEASFRVAKKHFPTLNPVEFVTEGIRQYRELVILEQPEEKPYLHELVNYLHEQGYKLSVASGSPAELIVLNLSRAGIKDYFSAFVGGQDVACGKPAPDIFLKAAHDMGVEPEACLVIEDGENGIRAAKAAGCIPVMIPDLEQPCEEVKALCSAIYENMGELLEELKK